MKTNSSTLRTMWLVILLYQLGLILKIKAQIPDSCITSVTNRPPENSDILVKCGTEYMDLSILLCPIYQARYNESLMVLNNQHTKPGCFGTANFTTDPPVLTFRFPINETSLNYCGNNFKITTELGKGDFADFSNVQHVNISGTVTSSDPSAGMITYRPQILYKFSCLYPMQYLLNNTHLGVSGVTLAINDNNGTFISTLKLVLYQDADYKDMLTVPDTGLDLKTKIYVSVVATNLTNRFNVLLDRCYASKRPYPDQNTYYDLFVGCTHDAQTKVEMNGVAQKAQFSFEAFRFVEDQNLTISTFYLHCVTRLCEVSTCSSLLPNCDNTRRRRREAEGVSANATVSSLAIMVGQHNAEPQTSHDSSAKGPDNNYSSPVVAVIICIIILAILLVGMAVYFGFFIRRRKPLIQ